MSKKFLGISRKVDELGRITIPMEICRTFGIVRDETYLGITVENGKIVLEPIIEQSELEETIGQVPSDKENKLVELIKNFIKEEC